MTNHFSTHAVETVAAWIGEGGLAYEPTEAAEMTELRRINESDDGWTVDVSAPLGGIVRYEQVRLSDDDLRVAHILGINWLIPGDAPMMTVTEARARALRPERVARTA